MKDSIQIYFFGQGAKEPKIVTLVDTAGSVNELLNLLINEGLASQGTSLFLDDNELPLSLSESIKKSGITNKCHIHGHKCQKISVSVIYNGTTYLEEFPPSTKAKKIISKSVKFFSIPEKDAKDLVLRLEDKTELQDKDSIALFAKECLLTLYLVHPTRVEG